jgi:DNA-binding transcriptional LysR family regulator
MKIQHLRFLAAVVEHGGVVRAAEALHVSQPAVSAGLRALEEELGQPLFERPSVGRRLRLRPNAEQFHRRALSILRECDIARAEFANGMGAPRRLRLGILPTLSERDVGSAVSALHRQHREMAVEIWEGEADRLAGWLRQGRIDAAWTVVEDPGPSADVLWREPFVVLAAHDHPLAGRQQPAVAIDELHGEPFVMRSRCEIVAEAREALRAAGVEPKFVARAEREEVAARLVALGLGVTIAPRSLARPIVACLSLTGVRLERSIGLRGRDDLAPEIRATLLGLLGRLHGAAEDDVGQVSLRA